MDLGEAFRAWTMEFVDEHDLGREAADWLIAPDRVGYPHVKCSSPRFATISALPEPVEELWGRYRKRMPYLVRCRPEHTPPARIYRLSRAASHQRGAFLSPVMRWLVVGAFRPVSTDVTVSGWSS